MKSVLVLASLVIGLSACSKKTEPVAVVQQVACSFEDIAVMSVSSSISSYAQCANVVPITAMVSKWAKQIDICKEHDKAKKKKAEKVAVQAGGISAKGVLGETICGPILSTISFSLLMQLPADAQCAGPVDMEKVKAELLLKCESSI